MTYREILDQLILMAGQDSGGEFEDMAKREVNNVYARCLEVTDTDLERRLITVSVASGATEVGLPLQIERVLNIEDTGNSRLLELISRQEFDEHYTTQGDTGTPLRAYPAKRIGVKAQPATAGTVTVESSAAADSGVNFKVALRGNSSSVPSYELITLTGTTPVTSTNSYDVENGIERMTLVPASTSTFTGTITLKDSDSNTLAQIHPYGDRSVTYEWWGFDPQPDDTQSYEIRVLMKKPPLVNDGDWPELPTKFHPLLIHGAAALIFPLVGNPEGAAVSARSFQQLYDEFQGSVQRRPRRKRQFAEITGPGGFYPKGRPLIADVDY